MWVYVGYALALILVLMLAFLILIGGATFFGVLSGFFLNGVFITVDFLGGWPW